MPTASSLPDPDQRSAHDDWSEIALRRTWRTLGWLCFGLGAVNAFISLLPAAVFFLIGLWAYGKGGLPWQLGRAVHLSAKQVGA